MFELSLQPSFRADHEIYIYHKTVFVYMATNWPLFSWQSPRLPSAEFVSVTNHIGYILWLLISTWHSTKQSFLLIEVHEPYCRQDSKPAFLCQSLTRCTPVTHLDSLHTSVLYCIIHKHVVQAQKTICAHVYKLLHYLRQYFMKCHESGDSHADSFSFDFPDLRWWKSPHSYQKWR